MRVISTQIPTISEEQENRKSPENTGFSGLFVFCFFISLRTVTYVFQHFSGHFVSYKCHIETLPSELRKPLLLHYEGIEAEGFYLSLHILGIGLNEVSPYLHLIHSTSVWLNFYA